MPWEIGYGQARGHRPELVGNPIGLVPLYLAVVGNESPAAQRRIPRRMMRLAQTVHRWIGDAGISIVTRVMGLVLTSMAVESILAGILGHFGR